MILRPILGRATVFAAALTLLSAFAFARPAEAVTVEKVISPGGIEAWYVRDTTLPVLAIEFSVKGGAAYDPAGKEGLADLAASTLDEGAGPYDSQAFQGKLQDLSLTLRFSAGDDTFRGSFRTLTAYQDEALELLRLALTEPRFDPEPVERIRAQIRQGLERGRNDPDTILGDVFGKAMYGDHPYGITTQQRLKALPSITAEDLKAFAKDRLVRDRLYIGVVGNLSPQELGAILDKVFGGLPLSDTEFALKDAVLPQAAKTIVVEAPVQQSSAAFGAPGVKRNDPDYYAAYVMNFILGGGGFVSRLTEEVREKRGLAYSVYSYLSPRDAAGAIVGGVATQNTRMKESLDVIAQEWKRMGEDGPTEEEMTAAKSYLTGSFPLSFSSSGSIARMLVGMQYNKLGLDYLDRYPDLINAVTLEDVKRVAARVLDPARLTTVVVGQPAGVEGTAPVPNLGG